MAGMCSETGAEAASTAGSFFFAGPAGTDEAAGAAGVEGAAVGAVEGPVAGGAAVAGFDEDAAADGSEPVALPVAQPVRSRSPTAAEASRLPRRTVFVVVTVSVRSALA
jgi:hypothetical protein